MVVGLQEAHYHDSSMKESPCQCWHQRLGALNDGGHHAGL